MSKSEITIGIPDNIFEKIIYTPEEIAKLLGCNDPCQQNDIEALGLKYWTMNREVKSSQNLEEINSILKNVRKTFSTIYYNEADTDEYWRLVIPMKEEDLPLDSWQESSDPTGPHIKTQINRYSSTLRIKARSLLQLSELWDKAYNEYL